MRKATLPSETVTVSLGEGRSYDILVGRDLLAHAADYIVPTLTGKRLCITTDKNVASTPWLAQLQTSLEKAGVTTHTIVINAGENTKSFSGLDNLLNQLLSFNPDRKTTLLALGGGVIGDITGFAASILLRGVPFIQVPTTLLAMVDSSVGGKTGINTAYGKNLVGSFYQPKLVLADLATLGTLPRREWLAGYAEVVKYGLINKPEFFDELEKESNIEQSLQRSIITCCRAKAEIVGEDEREAGKRALLNLGHTFGHALEAEMGYDGRLLHGEAVSVGMVMAFQFSEMLGLCPKADTDRVIKHLSAAGLKTSPLEIRSDFNPEVLLKHMYQDKKAEDGKLTLILVRGIGRAFVQKDVDAKQVLKFLIKITSNT